MLSLADCLGCVWRVRLFCDRVWYGIGESVHSTDYGVDGLKEIYAESSIECESAILIDACNMEMEVNTKLCGNLMDGFCVCCFCACGFAREIVDW